MPCAASPNFVFRLRPAESRVSNWSRASTVFGHKLTQLRTNGESSARARITMLAEGMGHITKFTEGAKYITMLTESLWQPQLYLP